MQKNDYAKSVVAQSAGKIFKENKRILKYSNLIQNLHVISIIIWKGQANEQAPIHLSLEEAAVRDGHKVFMKVDIYFGDSW